MKHIYMPTDFRISDALPADLLGIEALRRSESSALGFIPKSLFESIVNKTLLYGRSRWKYTTVLACYDNDDLTGYALAGLYQRTRMLNVFQIVVRSDARRWFRALRLIDTLTAEAVCRGLQHAKARVAADLEANLFWRAIGWTPSEILTSTWLNQRESHSKRPIIVYRRVLSAPTEITVPRSLLGEYPDGLREQNVPRIVL